jgi:hypothetical protein
MLLTGENWSPGRKLLYSMCGRLLNECEAIVEWYWQGKTEAQVDKYYTARVWDGSMSVEQWLNDTDRWKFKHWEKYPKKYVL